MNANSVVNLTLSVTDQFSAVTQRMGQAVSNLVRKMGDLATSMVAPSAEIAGLAVNMFQFLGDIDARLASLDAFKARLSSVGVNLKELAESLKDFSANDLSKTLSSFAAPLENVAKGVAPSLGAVFRGVGNSASLMSTEVVEAVNLIDQALIKIIEKAERIPVRLNAVLGGLSQVAASLSGVREPLEVFETLRGAVTKTSLALFGLVQEMGLFGLGLQAIQQLVTTGPFSALIGQNVELQAQLLATQASIVATNQVFKQGKLVEGTKEAITSLAAPIKDAITQLETGSRELSNVTSRDLVPIFSIVVGKVGQIGTNIQGATDLTLSFAAALGTLGIPLFQANQEIRSILDGQIDNNSRLALQLQITSAMVQQWKSQGTLVQELTERLSAFREGNKLAADQLTNVGSNIKDIFEIIQRTAGAPFLAPLVNELKQVYQFLDKNKDALSNYIRGLVDYAGKIGSALKSAFLTIVTTLAPIAKLIPEYLLKSLTAVAEGIAASVKTAVVVLEPAINLFALLAQAAISAGGPVLQLFLQFKTLQFGIVALTSSFALLFQIVEPFGNVLFLMAGRVNPLLAAFTGLRAEVGLGAAGFLLLGQRLNTIPGLAAKVASSIPLIGPVLAALAPVLATTGIELIALSRKFPVIQTIFTDLVESSPRLVGRLGALAGAAGFQGLSASLGKASQSIGQYASTTAFSTLLTEKFATAATLAGEALRAQLIKFAAMAGAIAVLGVAVNELVLKNQVALDLLKSLGLLLKDIGTVIYSVLASPITYLTAALAGLAYVITAQLLPSMLALKVAMLDGLLGALSKLLPSILAYASVMSKLGFIQAALATQNFALTLQAMIVQALSGTLTIGGLSTALLTLGASLAVALAPIAAVTAALVGIVALYQHVLALTERGGSVIPSAITNITEALKNKLGPFLSALPIQVQGLIQLLDRLKDLKVDGAITPTLQSANKALADSAGVNDSLKEAVNRTNEAKKKGIALTKEELDLNKQVVAKANAQLVVLEGEIANARRDLNAAKSDETKRLLEEKIAQLESRRDTLLVADAENNLKRITRQLDFARKDLANIKGNENKKLAEQQIADLEKQKTKLEGISSDIDLRPIILKDYGNTEKLLKERADAAAAILATPYDAKALKQGVSETIEILQQQLEIGTVKIEEGANRLVQALKIKQLEPEDRLRLEKALSAAIKGEYELRASAYDATIATQGRKVKEGLVAEFEGEEELTRLKKEQYKERLEGVEAQMRAELMLQKIRTGKSGEEDGNYSQAYKRLLVERQKLEEEANTFALDAYQKRLDLQLALVERQSDKMANAITAAEVEANTKIQVLLNSNSITQTQADELRGRSTRDRLAKEFALQKVNLEELQRLEKPKDPAKLEEYEKKVRDAKLKTSQLTLQLAEEEQRAQAAVFRTFSEQVDRQTKAMSTNLSKQSNEYQKQIEILKQIGGIISNQNKLLEQRQSLSSAISGYVGSELKLLAETARSEEEKAFFERAAAAERLKFLAQEQAFARQKLELSIQQKRIEDAQALRQNQVDQLTAIAESKQAEANLKKAQANPNALPEEIEAAKLDYDVKQQKILIERQKGIQLQESAAINRQGEGFDRFKLSTEQKSQEDRARVDLAKTLPPEQQQFVINQIRQELLQDRGFREFAQEASRNAFRNAFDGPRTRTPLVQLTTPSGARSPSLDLPTISTKTLESQSSQLVQLLADANATLVRIATAKPPVPPPPQIINMPEQRQTTGGLPR